MPWLEPLMDQQEGVDWIGWIQICCGGPTEDEPSLAKAMVPTREGNL